MKKKSFVTSVLGVVGVSCLGACGAAAPSFMEVSLTSDEYRVETASADASSRRAVSSDAAISECVTGTDSCIVSVDGSSVVYNRVETQDVVVPTDETATGGTATGGTATGGTATGGTATGETATGGTATGGTATGGTVTGGTATGGTATGETATGGTATGETATGETATGGTATGGTATGGTATGGTITGGTIELPKEPQNFPPNDEAMATCIKEWPADVASFAKRYTLVNVKNNNNRSLYSDTSNALVAHRIDLVTKNVNLATLNLLNPQASYCIRHDGWNANKLTVRVACSARLIELDTNFHIAHRLVVERVGCQ